MLWLASSPIFSWRSPTSRALQTDRSQPIVSLDGFMTRGWFGRLRFRKLHKQTRWLSWANHGPI
jgi:hypothetical protein